MADENLQIDIDGKPLAPDQSQRIQTALKQALQAELQRHRSALGFDDNDVHGSSHGSATISVS